MNWVNLAVTPHLSWPNTEVELQFEQRRLVLQPLTTELSCTVSVFDANGLSFEEGGTLLGRFLSRLAWSMNGGVVQLFIGGSNDHARPGRMGRGTYGISAWAAVRPWDYLYLPQPRTDEANLALALFREGMSVNSAPFAFLSFFKILNIVFGTGGDQKKWINANLVAVQYPPAAERLNELRQSYTDLGDYLYSQGRCAVAHANGQPLVDPDKYEDKSRLQLDLPVIKELAEVFIERELGVLSDSAFWERRKRTHGPSNELLKRTDLPDGRIAYLPVQ